MTERSLVSTFTRPCKAMIVGGRGGIGRGLLEQLRGDPLVDDLHDWSRANANDPDSLIKWTEVDITDEASISTAAKLLDGIDLVIVATGLLHSADGLAPEKSWRDLSTEQMTENFLVNTVGPTLVAKHVLPLLPRRERAVFAVLSARVGSIEDNRLGGWYSYRASKSALNQMIKSLSIELARGRSDAICVGLHPGTVDTILSRPFQSNVDPEKLFTTDRAARQLLEVINGLTPKDTGGVFAWDRQRIPY
ncbi:MAG: SDR family NAD(P)-dependent oxidoreductase [Hyphomicrobiaceae bacterium]